MKDVQAMAQQAYERGYEYEGKVGGCAQCVLCALKETALDIDNAVIKSATGLAAGCARSGHACGAFTGGVMALSTVVGREYDKMDDMAANDRTMELCRKLLERFEEAYGSCDCTQIQAHLMGRGYHMYDPEDKQKFLDAGGHDDVCTGVVGRSAKWVVELLAEEGLLK
ncbi:MAG: C-GCAxxG-C-C family protein [Eubacteriales bacterium]